MTKVTYAGQFIQQYKPMKVYSAAKDIDSSDSESVTTLTLNLTNQKRKDYVTDFIMNGDKDEHGDSSEFFYPISLLYSENSVADYLAGTEFFEIKSMVEFIELFKENYTLLYDKFGDKIQKIHIDTIDPYDELFVMYFEGLLLEHLKDTKELKVYPLDKHTFWLP